MPQSSPIPTRVLQRHQSQIARDLLAALKPIRFPDDQHKSQCGQRTHSGMARQAPSLGTLLQGTALRSAPLLLTRIEKGPTWGWAFETLRHAKLQFTPE